MSVMLHDEEQSRAWLRDRLSSHQWWVFVPVGEGGVATVCAIEERFYDGDANEDFEVFVGSVPPLSGVQSLVFAHKRRLSAQDLAEYIQQGADGPGHKLDGSPGSLSEQDVVYLADSRDDEGYFVVFAYALQTWLYGKDSSDA